MNKIWGFIIIFSISYGIFLGRGEILCQKILDAPKETFNLALVVIGNAIIFNGIMKMLEEVNVVGKIANMLTPLLNLIFPKLKDKKAKEYIAINIAANLFGLGFAATPSGLMGMKRLSEVSDISKDTASDEMVTFLVLNTAGVTLVPSNVIALRASLGSKNPADFMFIGLVGTLLSCVGGLIIERLLRKRIT